MAQIKRETASICTVADILNGTFVKTEGWAPSYFATGLGNLSRVNIMGFIVARGEDGLIVDDGTGKIVLRSFDNAFPLVDVGAFVLIIGRPRVYKEQKYVMPEVLKRIDPAWIEFRKVQLQRMERADNPETQERTIIKEEPQSQNPYQKVMEFIRDLDSGEGADMEEVIRRVANPGAEPAIRKLIEEGEIFEIKPGRLKVLE